MSHIAKRLKETGRRIRECNARIELYGRRIAGRVRNPALAEQAGHLLPLLLEHRKTLVIYRKRLLLALELETFLAPQDNKVPTRPPQLPRDLR